MSKKKRVPKTGPVWHQSAEEAALAKKHRYNGFACGHGAHGAAKYCRAKEKRGWEKQLRREGASHEAPSFLLLARPPYTTAALAHARRSARQASAPGAPVWRNTARARRRYAPATAATISRT